MSECGTLIPCTTFLNENKTISKFTNESQSIVLDLKQGLNNYMLPNAIRIRKGSVLMLTYNGQGRIGIENNQDFMNYSDFSLSLTIPYSLQKIDLNSRFMINSFIETGHYLEIIEMNKVYPIYYDYNLKLKLSNSDANLKAFVSINPTGSFISNLTYIFNKTFSVKKTISNGICNFNYSDYLRDEINPQCKLSK